MTDLASLGFVPQGRDTKTWSLSEKPYAQQMEQGQVSDG
jgi:hypothetical protein